MSGGEQTKRGELNKRQHAEKTRVEVSDMLNGNIAPQINKGRLTGRSTRGKNSGNQTRGNSGNQTSRQTISRNSAFRNNNNQQLITGQTNEIASTQMIPDSVGNSRSVKT